MLKFLSALLAAGALLGGASEAVADAPPLDWQPCEPAGFECATAEVPRDYARPHGQKLELALIRHPATDREHRIGSLFFNPGGPGGSGVDFVREAPPSAVAIFGRLYDVVGFDPRGVGASRPAVRDCAIRYAGDQYPRPDSTASGALVAAAREQLRRCAAGSDGILPYLTTGNVARDLDVLRAAVGDAQLNYVGLSYGGLIGETYATLFPGRTGAFVLDSPVDGDVWLNRPFEALREQQASFERSLDRFLQWCGRRPSLCALDPDDPGDDLDALVARLNAAPLPVAGEPPVNGDEVIGVAGDALYSKYMWAPLAAALTQAEQGDGGAIRALSGGGGGIEGAFFAYMANEGRYPGGVARFMHEQEHNYTLADRFWFIRNSAWVGLTLWPFEPRGRFAGPFRHAPAAQPALVLATTHDPATPYRAAQRFVADLGNARLLTYRGDGHGVITDLDPCVGGWFLAYIEAGTLPPEGASCRQQVPEPGLQRAAAADERLAWKRTTRPDVGRAAPAAAVRAG